MMPLPEGAQTPDEIATWLDIYASQFGHSVELLRTRYTGAELESKIAESYEITVAKMTPLLEQLKAA